jgi:catechol 2,3-dioxygenase-like lactoylglutathione lyase family enzyme
MTAMRRVVPALRITNYERSKKFYLDQLGFILEWEHRFEPKLPVFMSIALDGMRLYLSEHSGDCQVGGLVHFVVSDVDALHSTFKVRQVPINRGAQRRSGIPEHDRHGSGRQSASVHGTQQDILISTSAEAFT